MVWNVELARSLSLWTRILEFCVLSAALLLRVLLEESTRPTERARQKIWGSICQLLGVERETDRRSRVTHEKKEKDHHHNNINTTSISMQYLSK